MVDESYLSNENQAQPITETRSPAIRAGWLRALLFLLASAGLLALVGILVSWLGLGTDQSQQAGEAGLQKDTIRIIEAALTVFFTLGLIWLFRRFVDRRSLVSLGFSFGRQKRLDLLWGLLWGFGLITVVFLFLLSVNAVSIQAVNSPPAQMVLMMGFMVLMAFFEEIVFRGYLLNNLMTSINKYLALTTISVFFALGHLGNPNVTVLGLVNIVLAGLLLGIYYVHRQNLWFPWGVHFAWNFFQGPVYGASVSGFVAKSIVDIEVHGGVLLTGGEFGFEASLPATVIIIAAIVLIHLKYRPQGRKLGHDDAAAGPVPDMNNP